MEEEVLMAVGESAKGKEAAAADSSCFLFGTNARKFHLGGACISRDNPMSVLPY
jgi:hypothetical protein